MKMKELMKQYADEFLSDEEVTKLRSDGYDFLYKKEIEEYALQIAWKFFHISSWTDHDCRLIAHLVLGIIEDKWKVYDEIIADC
jgi:hypothetical protein